MNIKKYTFTGDKKFDINDFDTSDTGDFSGKEEVAQLNDEHRIRMEGTSGQAVR